MELKILCVMLVIGILAGVAACASYLAPPTNDDVQRICTPLVLDEIVAQNYRAQVKAEAEAEAQIIMAQETAGGINALVRAVAFCVVLAVIWLARQLWYFEIFIKR